MINKGMVPKEIANTIQENLRDEEGARRMRTMSKVNKK